ncbi:Putative conjugal transfer protein [Candidatus Thermoflexus japonica]|uniref:Conjugal transfer protein n=1 Tax=Candidatus Thermoflexus japonica TaxID=2035417 RepID=A0A2H5Y3Q4_9CHLR|nr:Putative conjugal transfer protein [Candidatus Thermoflexus japonica]
MSLLRRIQGNQPSPSPAPNPEPARATPAPEPPSTPPRRPLPTTGGMRDAYVDLKNRIQAKLLSELEPTLDFSRTDELRAMIEEKFDAVLMEDHIVLSRLERQRLFEQIVAEILGFGPLEPLLKDDTITEIMVNGPKKVYIERNGKIERTNVVFEDDEHLMRIIERIVAPLGRRVDESMPYVDARLPDGSRVNIVIPPISLIGPVVTIRKFYRTPLTVDDLIRLGSATPEVMEFLKACVQAKINIVVSGGTGSGKTTLLNILSGFIPEGERIITIENAAELQLRQEHVVTLETRPPNIEGKGEITMRDLVINALRMRPDRIIVGECRGGEAFDMLQAMNTGHEGSMTTIHANSPRDALARLENMVLMAGTDLPHRAIREQIAMAIDLIVQTARMRDGSRKIVSLTEIQGLEGEVITTTELFKFEQYGMEGGKIVGRLVPTGIRPRFMDRLEAAGIRLPPSIFGIGRK